MSLGFSSSLIGGVPRLVVAAQTLVDVLMYVDSVPGPGESCLATTCTRQVGGSFNVAVAAARLGMRTGYAGRVGTGPNADLIREAFRKEGIALLRPPVRGRDSGFDIALVESSGESRYIGVPGVEVQWTLIDLQSISLERGDAVYVSGYDLAGQQGSPLVMRDWIRGLGPEICCVFDPSPPVSYIDREVLTQVLSRTDLVTLNRREAEIVSGRQDIPTMAGAILGAISQRGAVVLRDGASGAWVCDHEHTLRHVEGFPASRVVDTTGAGDTHTGAVIAWLGKGYGLVDSVRAGNAAAALSVAIAGPATGPRESEVTDLLGRVTPAPFGGSE